MENSLVFYTLVLGISTTFTYIAQLLKRYKFFRNLFLILSFFVLWYVSANRYGIGTDYKLYENMYYEITSISNIKEGIRSFAYVEPGWVLFNYFVYIFFGDVTYIFSLSSFITLLLFYIFIYKNNNSNLWVSVLIYGCIFYLQSFNLVRQFMAMSICLFCIKYINQKNIFKFIGVILIATLFHFSAIVFIPIYFLIKNIEKLKVSKYFLLIGIVVIMLFYNQILTLIINITGFEKYSIYYSNGINISYSDIIFKLVLLIIVSLNLKVIKKDNVNIYRIINIYYIGILLSFLSFFAPFIGRISYYFEMCLVIIIPNILKYYKGYTRIIFNYSILIILYIYFVYYSIILNYGQANVYFKL